MLDTYLTKAERKIIDFMLAEDMVNIPLLAEHLSTTPGCAKVHMSHVRRILKDNGFTFPPANAYQRDYVFDKEALRELVG